MREIKFRVWEKTGKVMDYQPEFLGGYINTLWEDDGIVFMQYTGLKDKSGREIYEGDILDLKAKGGTNLKVVVWNDTDACFGWIDGNNDSWPDGFTGFYDEYEVIGNIYENPELLDYNNEKND